MAAQEEFEFDLFKKQTIPAPYSGKSSTGTDSIFDPLMKHYLGSMIAGELDRHLTENKQNGTVQIERTTKPAMGLRLECWRI